LRRLSIFIGLLAGLLLVAGHADGQGGAPRWTTYLNVNDLRSLAYDGARLWIATGGGAVAFDPVTGETSIYHRMRDGLLSDSLGTVVLEADGRIWFGTVAAGISIFDPEAETWEPYASVLRPIPGDDIQRIVLTPDTLMVGTKEGFTLQIAGEDGMELRLPCQEGIDPCDLPSFDVRDLASDPGGDGIWIATAAGVVHHDTVGTGDWTTYAAGPPVAAATRLIRHRGEWVASFPDGVRVLRPSGESRTWFPFAEGMTANAGIVDLLSEGQTLLAAGAKGVWSSEAGGPWTLVGGRAIQTRAILRTPDGSLWAAGYDSAEILDGLWRFDGATWTRRTFPGPSLRAHYLAIAFDPGGILHVATARESTVPMRQTFDGITWTAPRNLEDWTWDFAFESQEEFWLAQCCCGAQGCSLRFVENNVSRGQTPRNLRDLAFDARGNLWAASDNDIEEQAQGIWFRDASTGAWTWVTLSTAPQETMRSNRVRAILPWNGELWIGYREKGVHRWYLGPDGKPLTPDDGNWTLYAVEEVARRRIVSDQVTRLAVQGSTIWVGTAAGVSLIDADLDHVTNIGPGFDRLPLPVVNALLPVADGGAWVATGTEGKGGGLTRMSPTEDGFSYVTYGPPDLPHPNVETLALDPDGWTVWIGTNRGLSRLVPPAPEGGGSGSPYAYPNPYVPGCGEGVRLQGFSGLADGEIMDLAGRVVRRFRDKQPGTVVWDGRDESGRALAPGLYWIRVSSPDGVRGVGVGLGDGPCP
jgi:ligand-binding sensor domain-containing protein